MPQMVTNELGYRRYIHYKKYLWKITPETMIFEENADIGFRSSRYTSIAKLVNAILVRQLLVTESICEWCKVLLEKMCWFEANQSRIFVSFLFDLTFVM